MNLNHFVSGVSSGAFDERFRELYGYSDKIVLRQRSRLLSAAENFSKLYPLCGDIRVFSAPGRAEIGGNHTDHQRGCVLAAAVDLDVIAIVSRNDDDVIRITSEGFGSVEFTPDELAPVRSEKGSFAALARGVLRYFADEGAEIGGFDAYAASDIPPGKGLSSSAAFEVLIGVIANALFYNGAAPPEKLAAICSRAENSYFGKPCGLMDQIASAFGGFAFADLAAPEAPVVKPVDFDFRSAGYVLCVTDAGDGHSGLTDEYAAIEDEMSRVAKLLGADRLRDTDEDDFYVKLPELRKSCTDRELLRACHFYSETRRAALEAEALRNGDTEGFFALVKESADSSAELLQNLYSIREPASQPIPLALAISNRLLAGSGASRVHGGGFAGSVIAFVPAYTAQNYVKGMNGVFGEVSCRVLHTRKAGGCELKL